MQRILGALRAAHRGAGHESAVPDAPFPAVADGHHAVVGRHGNAVRERTAVHYSAQNTVVRILVDGTRAISRAWAGSSSPRIGEEQIAFGIEVEIVGAFEQLVPVGVNQSADLLRLRVEDQNAAMTRRKVEFAIVPPRALRFTGLAKIRGGIAIEYWDQLGIRGQIRNPPAADCHEPQIALTVERSAFEELALRRVADVGEFLDRTDTCRQWRQTPWLSQTGGLSLGGASGAGDRKKETEQRGTCCLAKSMAFGH